ncbi:hypothetical protein EDB83DRAFT_2521532 [Lactarius deliciosus]|nr:hypothetical protein EDB83DRAFT_2521532 [Lactarius deliciosus]
MLFHLPCPSHPNALTLHFDRLVVQLSHLSATHTNVIETLIVTLNEGPILPVIAELEMVTQYLKAKS